MSDWPIRTLGDVCEDLTVGHVGSMASQYVPSGVPFLRSQNVRVGRLNLANIKYIPQEFHRQLRKSQLRQNDIVIVRTGEPGAAALIPNGIGELNCSDLVIARPARVVDPQFLCYAINATAGQYIAAHLVGAVQQHFNVSSARNIQLAVPPLGVQQAIATVLGTLDDKIVVNDRIAAISSDLITELYKLAVMEHGSAVVSLTQAVTFDFGLPFSSKEFRAEGQGLPLMRIRDLKTFTPQVWTTERLAGDIVVGPGDVVAGMDAEFRLAFWLGKPALLNQRVFRGRSLVAGGSRSFVREVLAGPLAEIERHKTGTTVIHLNKRDLELSSVVVPTSEAVHRFEASADPLRIRIVSATQESAALAELRDALLPGLMSGEILVRDAETIVGDVT